MSLMIDSWIDWLNIGGLAWLILVIRFYTSVSSLRESARLSAQRAGKKSTKSLALIISARPVSKLPAWRETLVLQHLRDQQQSTKECMNQSSGSLIGWINFLLLLSN